MNNKVLDDTQVNLHCWQETDFYLRCFLECHYTPQPHYCGSVPKSQLSVSSLNVNNREFFPSRVKTLEPRDNPHMSCASDLVMQVMQLFAINLNSYFMRGRVQATPH